MKARTRAAQITAVNTTMSACILRAKANHGPGAHQSQRFETQTGSLERSIQIDLPARVSGSGVMGRWGSMDTNYALRIEFGFQGKDSKGRVIDQPAFPFLRPAADAEYPKLFRRIKAAL